MEENTPNQISTPQAEPMPETLQQTVPPIAPVFKELSPEEKKIKRKAMLKRMGMLSGVLYITTLILIILWAVFLAEKELILFDYLPLAQATFSGFLFKLFNLLLGLSVFGLMLMALAGVIRSLLSKKEEVDKKKKFMRSGIFYGIGTLLLGVLWLTGLWFLGPRLVTEIRYGSLIITDPSNTIGLTSPVTISFDASQIPVDRDVYSILSYAWNFGDGSTATGQTVTHKYTQKAQGNGVYTVTLNVEYMDLKSGERFDYEETTQVVIENELTAASFIANPDSGEIPLIVEFDATSSFDPDGEIVSYEWDFDEDGRYDDAEGEIVEYEFTQEGTYEVSLRVTDNNGESTTTSEIIEAGSIGGLRAIITAPVKEGASYYVDEKYEFEGDLSQIREGKIVKYEWDLGDGNSKTSKSVSHSYERAGTYELVLTIYDADGNKDETILEIIVMEEGSPPLVIIETDVTSGPVPLKVNFDASESSDPEDDIVEYEWDFDNDGRVDETGDTAVYTYQKIGDYEARLILTDSVGNISESTVLIQVTEQGIQAVLEANISNGEVPLTVQFNASGSSYKEGSIVSYEINFGDGSDLYVGDATVTYKYNAVGTYTATLTVVGNDGKKASDSMQIVVRPVSLTACFEVNTGSGAAPLFIVVDPSCSQGTIQSYEWNFGDGDISFDRKPGTHTYSETGTYIITLEITEKTGIIDSFSQTIIVK